LGARDDREQRPARSYERGQAQPRAGRELGPHCGCSARRRRRSRSGRALVTYGTLSKFQGGGGEVVYHSSVSATQGSLPARGPLRVVFTTLTTKISMPTPIT